MKNLKNFNLKSNPFDILIQAGLEIGRVSLIANSRLKNKNLPYMDFTEKTYQYLIDRMAKCIKILNSIPKDELEICRENCLMSNNEKQMGLNEKMYNLFREFETEYSQSIPYLNDKMEAILYGTESEIYKRHLTLKRFFEKHKDKPVFANNNLWHYIDFLDNGKDMSYCKEYNYWNNDEIEAIFALDNLFECELKDVSIEDITYLQVLMRADSKNLL